MELTPIKIPGKNTRDNSKAGITARRALNRPSGRPPKSVGVNNDSNTMESSDAVKPKKRSLKNIKSKRKMSDLEKLPVELLEKVFLFCMNPDLPRSSPVIAGKLSSSVVYTKTIIAAFGPSWRQTQPWVDEQHEDLTLGGADPVVQSALLRCRWVTLDRILTSRDSLTQRELPNQVEVPFYFLTHPRWRAKEDEQRPTIDWLRADFREFSAFALQRDGGELLFQTNWNIQSLLTGVEIPESLLYGPWTDDMLMYLFWLIKFGAKIDWITSTSGEVALAGLETAIKLGDTRAIHLLAWAGLREKLKFDKETLLWTLENAGGDKFATITHIIRLGSACISNKDFITIELHLEKMRDEAERVSDSETLSLLRELSTSEALAEFRGRF